VLVGGKRITLVDEILQRVQRVKQKVRIQLGPDGFKLGVQLLSDHDLLPVLNSGVQDKYQRN
jgi:hypothetical protein